MNRQNDPLSHLPDWEALLHDRRRFLNRLVWSVVLSPPVSRQQAGPQRPPRTDWEHESLDAQGHPTPPSTREE